jgi:hypothetical protein
VMEAARIDGAGPWQTAWRVQIPMLRKPTAPPRRRTGLPVSRRATR